MTKSQINKIAKSKKITFCYIRKRGSYYRPNHSGYTEYRTKAGIYAKEDAIKSAMQCDELDLIPIDIQQHNSEIIEQIKDLSTRLIEQKL